MPTTDITSGSIATTDDTDMTRRTKYGNVVVTDTIGTTVRFDFTQFAGGQINIGASPNHTTLTFYSSSVVGGEMSIAQTDAEPPADITRTVTASRAIPIPKDLYAAAEISILGDNGTSDTYELCLKG